MFTQTPVGGRRVRNQRQWSKVITGDRPAAPLPSSGASPSFSYGSPSINPPDIPSLHDTTVGLASALRAAQKNTQRKDYINENITPLKQPKFLKQELSNTSPLYSPNPRNIERKKGSQRVLKKMDENLDSSDNHFQNDQLNMKTSGNNFKKNTDQDQNIKQNEKVSRYYLREHDSVDGGSRLSLNYDATNNSENLENFESRSYEEEELLYSQLNETDFKDFFDNYDSSIPEDYINTDSQEYLDDDYEKQANKILNFIHFCWFMITSLSRQFIFYCFNLLMWPITTLISLFSHIIKSILKITIRKVYTIFIILSIIFAITIPSLLEKNYIKLKWIYRPYSLSIYNHSNPQNMDELIQRLVNLEKTLKSYEITIQNIIQDKKNILKAIKEIDIKGHENSETTKLLKKEFNVFKNSFEKTKKEILNLNLQDDRKKSQITDLFHSFSFLQKNTSKCQSQFNDCKNSLASFNLEVSAIKKSVDCLYKEFNNFQMTFKNDSDDKYITDKIIKVIDSYLPPQLVVKINPKTKKIDISPEFWILLREIFPDRLEIDGVLKASFGKELNRDENASYLISWTNFLKNNEENMKTFIKTQTKEDLKKSEENGLIVSKTYFMTTLKENLKKIQNDLENDFTKMKEQINDRFKKIDYMFKNKTETDHLKYSKNENAFNKAIETLVKAALHKYSSDVLARPDFALYSSGARINPFLTSPTYLQRPTRFIPRLLSKIFWNIGCTWGYPPAMAINHENTVGMCWAFPGSSGQISIRLSETIFLTDITIEHVHSDIAHDISTAPRDIQFWAHIDHPDLQELVIQHTSPQSLNSIPPSKSYFLIATMTYNIFSTYSIQTFPIPTVIQQLNIPVKNVLFRILSNWGNDKFTCLYRIRVHGTKLTLNQTTTSNQNK
ncbi:hypothetical protein PNEG_00311 [Pneumocystis murina B123]|uniref:SUN domain-containing protein n=1 Tax=Pneumocystis murina (strain B123) TaxID=1069680 RepID=M7NRD8_PNEMU|nr:hypothetical protein PNEG_00311 [Pneumocystis murina B123]EMR11283.1 hypothetical protein PNEG_00311 [Pneumocystis murina B123]